MRWPALLFVASSTAHAQVPDDDMPPHCDVYLVDATTTAPIAGAVVRVGLLEGTTDGGGRFAAAGATGPQTVSASARGYRALDAGATCDAGAVTLRMQPESTPARELAFQYPSNYERRIGWQGELGLVVGDARVDGAPATTTPGLVLAGGLRLDRFTVLGEYALAGIRYQGPFGASARGGVPLAETDGLVHHVGLAARYAFARIGAQPIVAFWLEGGAGEQVARWDHGGTFARPDLMLGLGMHIAVPTSAGVRRGGAFIALRAYLGRRTDVDSASATCVAPCTMDSPPAAWSDKSLLLHAGYTFGN